MSTISVNNALLAPLDGKDAFGPVKHCLPKTPMYFTGFSFQLV